METPKLGPGINKLGKRIAPGFWEDADGNAHCSIPELLEFVGLEDTPENHKVAKEMLERMIKESGMKAVFRATPDDKGTVL